MDRKSVFCFVILIALSACTLGTDSSNLLQNQVGNDGGNDGENEAGNSESPLQSISVTEACGELITYVPSPPI